MLSPQQNYVMFVLVTLTLQYVHTSISYISSFSWYSTTTRFFTLYTYNIYDQHHIVSSLVVKEFQGALFCQRITGCLVLFEGCVVLDTIIVTRISLAIL